MRIDRALPLAAAVLLLAAPAAGAHVTIQPGTAAADSFARFVFRVPTERGVPTTSLTVRLPEGLTSVSFQPKAGWKRTVTMAKLDPPVQVFGEMVTERVATVTWSGGRIGPGEFDEFGVSAHVPDASGDVLTFPALQTYQGGEIVRWIGPPDADEPAPSLTLTAKEPEEGAAAPTATTTAAASEDDGDDDGSTTLALVLGAAGLVAGLAGLGVALAGRRRTPGTP